MPSKIRHGLIISIAVVALLFVPVVTSYPRTTTYIYDELNRLIRVVYDDGRSEYTYDASGNRITVSQTTDVAIRLKVFLVEPPVYSMEQG